MMDWTRKAAELEEETREKVSASISSIESALAQWEASKERPEGMRRKIGYLKKSHKLLKEWLNRSLRGGQDYDSITWRIKEFSWMCNELKERRPKDGGY